MVAWMDAEALAATIRTGEVHFHSRSRGRLWRKGETSGNVLHLRGIATDCDQDALLVSVEPHGPTCHRGTRSCFDPDGAPAARQTQAPGPCVSRGAVGDDSVARRGAPGRLLHRLASRGRRRRRRAEGHRGGDRGPHRREGRCGVGDCRTRPRVNESGRRRRNGRPALSRARPPRRAWRRPVGGDVGPPAPSRLTNEAANPQRSLPDPDREPLVRDGLGDGVVRRCDPNAGHGQPATRDQAPCLPE